MPVSIRMLGHAGLRIDHASTGLVVDPWFSPAYMGTWFPFPANHHCRRFLEAPVSAVYLTHTHHDHWDAAVLRDLAERGVTAMGPAFEDGSVERLLRSCGFRDIRLVAHGETVRMDGGAELTAWLHESDGLSDSSFRLVTEAGSVYNQNDAHPEGLAHLTSPPDVHLLQFSGAHWYPTSYELPAAERLDLGARKRSTVMARAIAYLRESGARWAVPFAGPACFLADDLHALNDLARDGSNPFPDLTVFLEAMQAEGMHNGVRWYPGTRIELHDGALAVEPQRPAGVDPYEDKARYLATYREDARARGDLDRTGEAAAAATRYAERFGDRSPIEVLGERVQARLWCMPGLEAAPPHVLSIRSAGERCAIDVRHRTCATAPDGDGLVPDWEIDVPEGLLREFLVSDEQDLASTVFLSYRCRMRRACDYFDEAMAVLRTLGAPGCGGAAATDPAADDPTDIVLDGHLVPRWCPHRGADLSRYGIVEDGHVVCVVHGRRFALAEVAVAAPRRA